MDNHKKNKHTPCDYTQYNYILNNVTAHLNTTFIINGYRQLNSSNKNTYMSLIHQNISQILELFYHYHQ